MKIVCICCASLNTREAERKRKLNIGGKPLAVEHDVITKCDDCRTTFYTASQAAIASRKVAEAKRLRDGLMTSSEIKTLRQSFALSQAALEAALGVGSKTVVRWENDLAVQSKALDDVLRLIAFDPDNLRFLVRIRDHDRIGKVDKGLADADERTQAELAETIKRALKSSDPAEAVSDLARVLTMRLRNERLQRIERLSAQHVNSFPAPRKTERVVRRKRVKASKKAA